MSYWVLASHPGNFRVLDSVLARDEDWWRTGGRPLRSGDRVAIWKYKGRDAKRGVITLGVVLTDPVVMDLADEADAYWLPSGRPMPSSARRVRVRYVRPNRVPLWLGERPGSVVDELSVSRAQGGTAFRVTDDQWQRLLEETGGWPREISDSVTDAAAGIESIVRGRTGGQGFGMNAARRRAIELRAMAVVAAEMTARGWAVSDVSASSPYDLLCRKEDEIRRVEVKGTGGAAGVVLLTKNEVTAARADPGSAVLAVVYDIALAEDVEGPRGSGGQLLLIENWQIEEGALEPLSFRYTVPLPPAS